MNNPILVSLSVKICQISTDFLKNGGFENPSLKIDGFGRTHRTHGKYAPANKIYIDIEAELEDEVKRKYDRFGNLNYTFTAESKQSKP